MAFSLKGGGPDYPAQTGRRDGLVSKAEDVDLPSPTLTVPETIAVFQAKNFTPEEMVVLLGTSLNMSLLYYVNAPMRGSNFKNHI